MHDDKRLLRKMKKEVKRSGTRKRRRYLKDLTADPDQFEFGGDSSQVFNEQRRKARQKQEKQKQSEQEHTPPPPDKKFP